MNMRVTTTILGVAIVCGAGACAAFGGWGEKVPVVGSSEYKEGKFPDPSKLPVVSKSAAEIAEYETNDLLWCDYRVKPPKIDNTKLGAMEAAIRFWVKPPKEAGSAGEALGLDKLMVDGITSTLGFTKVDKFSLACTENNAAVHVNGTWYGPFNVLHVDTAGMGKLFVVSAWSTERRHLLYTQVNLDPESPVNPTLLTDFSRYVPEKDVRYGARMSMGSIVEATLVKSDGSGGWFIKTPYGGGIYGAFTSTISALRVGN